MYPRIILRIKNHVPSIVFEPEEGLSRTVTSGNENIANTVVSIAKDLTLISEAKDIDTNDSELESVFSQLLALATEGNEKLIDQVPILVEDLAQFGFEKFVNSQITKFLETSEKFSEIYPEAKEEVIKELHKNENIDILASILEMIYMSLTAKVLMVAQELGVGEIVLDDKDGHARLRERITSEFGKLDIDLVIE